MNFSEREYFVSRVRSGFYIVDFNGLELKVLAPTVEDNYMSNREYKKVYERCLSEGIMTQEEMLEWMYTRGLWSEEKEAKLTELQQNLKTLKEKIYLERFDQKIVDTTRLYLRRTEEVIKDRETEKNSYFKNTCDSLAYEERAAYLFSRCCYLKGNKFEFEDKNYTNAYYEWILQVLDSTSVRELARTEPWRSIWNLRDVTKIFPKDDERELTYDQKNIVSWSTMYDSINESHEPPPENVIQDDDMLDGWFIVQKKKREQEKNESEMEKRVGGNANHSEVYVVAKSELDDKLFNQANSPAAKMIKRQRNAVIDKQEGQATDLDFVDTKFKLQRESNRQFKSRR